MDTNTLMMMMLLSSGRSSNMMPLLLLMMLSGNNSSGSNSLSSIITPQNLMLGIVPGIGTLGRYMLGGVGAVVAGSLLKKRTYRKRSKPRTTIVYRNGSQNYRRY